MWRVRARAVGVVEPCPSGLALGANVAVDVREVVLAAERVLTREAAGRESAPNLNLLSGELLPDWYDDWVLLERERLRELCVRAIEELVEEMLEAGRAGEALAAALLAVRSDPLRDSAQRALIRVHLAEGNVADAVRGYNRYRTLLWAEMRLSPSAQMEDLVRAVTVR
jgi:DNA-binding SARP family transcriptional activator